MNGACLKGFIPLDTAPIKIEEIAEFIRLRLPDKALEDLLPY